MLKVVIMDGNAIARNLLTSVLTSGGHEVIGDTNTNAANLARMVKLKPQVVCIDIGDGGEEGYALLDELRQALPKSLVFLVSGKLDEEMIKAAHQRGVHGFIVKPFNQVAVLGTIRNTIIKIAKQQKTKAEGDDEAPAST
jgi:DNA-binding NtrC family response regulator